MELICLCTELQYSLTHGRHGPIQVCDVTDRKNVYMLVEFVLTTNPIPKH